ncbi:unnamed protein product [Gordionus sp. m RMFG-2023]|uniref:uncharacterized protein LOC135929327 n=1 Tax=Gordionus sp. m RMFG-2023 TaxID=3053472 RepID=UPI0030DE5009
MGRKFSTEDLQEKMLQDYMCVAQKNPKVKKKLEVLTTSQTNLDTEMEYSSASNSVDNLTPSMNSAHSSVSNISRQLIDPEWLKEDVMHCKCRIETLKQELNKGLNNYPFSATNQVNNHHLPPSLLPQPPRNHNLVPNVGLCYSELFIAPASANNYPLPVIPAKMFNSDPLLQGKSLDHLYPGQDNNYFYYYNNHNHPHDSNYGNLADSYVHSDINSNNAPSQNGQNMGYLGLSGGNVSAFSDLSRDPDGLSRNHSFNHGGISEGGEIYFSAYNNSSLSKVNNQLKEHDGQVGRSYNNANDMTCGRQSSYPETNFPVHHQISCGRNLSETSLLQIMYLNEREKLEKLKSHLSLLETVSQPEFSNNDDKDRILQMQQKDNLLKRYKRIAKDVICGEEINVLNQNIASLEKDLQTALRFSNQTISERIKLQSEKNNIQRQLQTSMEELAKIEERLKEKNGCEENPRLGNSNSSLESAPYKELDDAVNGSLPPCSSASSAQPSPPPISPLNASFTSNEEIYLGLLHKERQLQYIYQKIVQSKANKPAVGEHCNDEVHSICKVLNTEMSPTLVGKCVHISTTPTKVFKREDTLTENKEESIINTPIMVNQVHLPTSNPSSHAISPDPQKNDILDSQPSLTPGDINSSTLDEGINQNSQNAVSSFNGYSMRDTKTRTVVLSTIENRATSRESTPIFKKLPNNISKSKTITECYAFV